MADPLSIAASTASLVAVCGKITHFLSCYIMDVSNVNDVLLGLSKEVESLSTALESISTFWKSTGPFTTSVPTELVAVLASLRTTLDDCQTTLEHLETKLASPGNNRIMRQLKLSLRMGDIQLLRQRIQSHTGAANLVMQAIHLYVTSKNINEQIVVSARMNYQLGQISAQIKKLKGARARSHGSEQTRETDRIIGNVSRLVEVTEAYASTTYGEDDRSTIINDSASTKSRDRIYSWLSDTGKSPIPTDRLSTVSTARSSFQHGPDPKSQHDSGQPLLHPSLLHPSRGFPNSKTRGNNLLGSHETKKHDTQLAKCLDIMVGSDGLRGNICRLTSPATLKAEIRSQTINQWLSEKLQNACSYWVYHFERGTHFIRDQDRVHDFLQKHFLHWLEALIFIDEIPNSLQLVDALISRVADDNSTQSLAFLMDARRFILYNRSIIRDMPLQLYSCALAFAPSSSIIRQTFKNDIPDWISPPSMAPTAWGLIEEVIDGHSREVTGVAFSPDGSNIASASADKTLRVWDSATGQIKRTLKGHVDEVRTVAFSPDGLKIVSGSADSTIRVWDVTTGQLEKTLRGHSHWVKSIVFSPDGHKLASGSWDNKVILWNITSGQVEKTLQIHSDHVNGVAFSPDGTKLASASADLTVRIWDVAMGWPERTLECPATYSVAFSPDGLKLASGSIDQIIRLWSVVTGREELKLKGHSANVTSLKFSPDGRKLISGSSDSTIRVWNVVTGLMERKFDGHSDSICSVAVSPDGNKLLSGSNDQSMLVWNISKSQDQAERMPENHIAEVTCAAFSPDGSILASGSGDNTVRVWDVSTGRTKWVLEGHERNIYDVTFSPDGRKVVSASADSTTRMWDVVSGRIDQKLDNPSNPMLMQSALSAAFSRDGKTLASGYFDMAAVWHAASGKLVRKLEGQYGAIRGLAFSPDGTKLVSGSVSFKVVLWDIATGSVVWKNECRISVTSVAFSPDGRLLATRSGHEIQVWDAKTGPGGPAVQALKDHFSPVTSRGFLLDGTYSPTWSVVGKRWVCCKGSKLLHLPIGVRPGVVASSERAVAIGSPSGRVTIISLSRGW